MDRRVIEQKLESLRYCVARVRDRCPADVDVLKGDPDAQDIVVLNLSRAVQQCVDIAAHVIAESELQPPETMGQTFDRLAEGGFIDTALADRLKRSVGFRNVAVHNYQAIDWAIVHAISRHYLDDFRAFAKAVSGMPRDES
jgi:uncharacterized protein YutE (UPF0331/DUF86 family)